MIKLQDKLVIPFREHMYVPFRMNKIQRAKAGPSRRCTVRYSSYGGTRRPSLEERRSADPETLFSSSSLAFALLYLASS